MSRARLLEEQLRTFISKGRRAQVAVDEELRQLGVSPSLLDPTLLTLDLPLPPSEDNYFKPVPMKNGKARFVLGKEGKAYRKEVWVCVCQQRARVHMRPLTGRLSVRLVFHFPTSRSDVCNYDKAPFDALTVAGVWNDDNQIDQYTVERGEKRRPGRVIVTISEYRGAAPPYSGDA